MYLRIATGYLSTAAGNGATTFDLLWNRGADELLLRSTAAALGTYSQISRVDFFDPDSQAVLAIIPCVAASSSVALNDDGTCDFTLSLNNLLGGPNPPCSFTVNTALTPSINPTYDLFFDSGRPSPFHPGKNLAGFMLGDDIVQAPEQEQDEDQLTRRYVENLTALLTVGDNPSFKVQGAALSSFESPAVSGRTFLSEHITFSSRNVLVSAGKQLPVLTVRRGYTIGNAETASANRALATLFPGAFDLPIFTDPGSKDSDYHVVQFPGIDWLKQSPAPGSLVQEPVVWQFETGEFPPDQIQQFWSARVQAPYVGGLRMLNDPLAVSTVPSLAWSAVAGHDASWRVVRTTRVGSAPGQLKLLSERLLPGGYLSAEDLNLGPAIELPATWTLEAFRTHGNTPLSFPAGLKPWTDFSGEETVATSPAGSLAVVHSMQCLFTLGSPVTSQMLRLGSLDLTFGGAFPEDSDPGEIQPLSVRIDFDFMTVDTPWIPRLYIAGSLPVTRYGPGGQDEPANENGFRLTSAPGSRETAAAFTRSTPIVIDSHLVDSNRAKAAGNPLPDEATAFSLTFRELTLPSPQQQQLVLSLSKLGEAAPVSPGVLVLDREPLLIAYVTLGAAADSDDTDSTLVGVWCNLYPEGPGWRLRAGAGGFNLYLPPQAVGEAMVKDFDPAIQPTADYRFSPLLKARLLAYYSAQNAVEPGWNLRRVLGYAGERFPGALLDDKNGGISFELLYGMTATVTQPGLRLAEMFARLGQFAGPLPALDGTGFIDAQYSGAQIDTYNTASGKWAKLYSQLLSRPGVLELSAAQQGPDLLLDEGVQYSLREEAFYTDAHPERLHGGIGYAIDSENVRQELLKPQNRTSVAGRLASPRFTALGGYGTQRAEFAKGKVILESRTSMGRLETMTVTLVGRIGTLYNHALHITVYERTVLPTDQFALDQDLLQGIPLLRKTREYVQITEDTRTYPEDSSSDPALSGFVDASHFKSIRINVDSRWGGDVGTIGWQVPLWEKDVLPLSVYPKPHIALKVAVDPATGVDSVFGEIDDPEKLCFYTDTRDNTTSDTNSWPTIYGIDWIDQPADTSPGAAGEDPSIEPGFGRFTYHFVTSPAQVNVVASRSKTAIGATLKNVSMMRGQRLTPATAPGDAPSLVSQATRRIVDRWAAAKSHLAQAAKTAATMGDAGAGYVAKELQAVQTAYLDPLVADLGKVTNPATSLCQAATARLNSAFQKVNGEETSVIQSILVQFPDGLRTSLDNLTIKPGDALDKTFIAAIDHAFTATNASLSPLAGSLNALTTAIDDYGAKLKAYQADIAKLQVVLATYQSGQSSYPAIVAALTAVLPIRGANRARDLAEQAAASLDRETRLVLGGSGTNLLPVLQGAWDASLLRLNSCLQGGVGQLDDLVTEVAGKLVQLQNALQAAIDAGTVAKAGILPILSPLDSKFNDLHTALTSAVATNAAAGKAAVENAIDQAIAAFVVPAAGGLNWADQKIQEQEDWIGSSAGKLCSLLKQDIDALKKDLIQRAQTELQSLLQYGGDLESALRTIGDPFESQLQQVTAAVSQDAQAVASGVAGAAIRVIRSFGEPPHVPNMSFKVPFDTTLSLPTMAYRFNDALPTVDMTPARAIVTQVADRLSSAAKDLSQLGISLPSSQLLDRLIPDPLEGFDLRDILPHFAGIELSTLFSGVRMPSIANDTVRVTHHVDPQTKRASLDVDIHVPLAGDTSILDLGPVNLRLLDAEFTAQVHSEVVVGQQIRQTSSGEITGDWELLICGLPIVTFTRTTLSFDSSGKLHFSITPANIRLTAVLQFLADLVNSLTFGDSGFSIHMTPDPLAVQCILDLPLPDMSAGAFGVQNLRFGALFEIGMDVNGFYLGVGANLARKTAPFILTVFVLGGAGWMEASLRYQNGATSGEITIGMAASAALAISLGPISGSVSIQFGIFVEYMIGNNGGLQIGIMILIVGRVSLCGIIDANITLLLEAEYSSGGGLVGRGYVSISIKICWCFTLSVHSSVQFGFGASKQSQPAAPQLAAPAPARAAAPMAVAPAAAAVDPYDQYKQSALDYIDMLA